MKPYITNHLIELNDGDFLLREGDNYFLVSMAMVSPAVVNSLLKRNEIEPIPARTFIAEGVVPKRGVTA